MLRSFLSFLLTLTCISCKTLWNLQDNKLENSILADATQGIVEAFFKERCITLNIIRSMEPTFDEVATKILIENRGGFAVRLNTKLIENRKKKFNIVMIENIESFRIFNEKVNSDVFDYRGFYLLTLADANKTDIEEIFITLWKKKLYNVNLLYRKNDTAILTTFLPFGSKKCGDTRPRTINTFRNGSYEHKNFRFFPEKFNNLKSCSLKVSTYEDEVAVIRNRNSDGSFTFSGFAMDLLVELSKSLTFQLKITSAEGDQALESALGEVFKGNADIAIGNYALDLSRLIHVDSSDAFYSFPLVFVISPGSKLTDLDKLLQPFHRVVWLLLSITIIIALLVIIIIKFSRNEVKAIVFGSEIKYPLTYLIIGILGGSQTKLPKRSFPRFLLMMFLIFCLIMRNAYQGSLYKFLQTDSRHKNVQTIDDMIDQEFDIYISKSFFGLLDKQLRFMQRTKIFVDNQEKIFLNTSLSSFNRVAFVNTMTNVINANMRNKDTFSHTVCKEYLLTMNIVMYFPRNFYLVEAINEKIGKFISSGIMKHLIDRYVDMKYWKVKMELNHGPEKLSFEHLEGAFFLWMLLLVVSFVVFLLELLIGRYTNSRRV